MLFNKVFMSGDCSNRDGYLLRKAVRAVVVHRNKLLLISTNRGDYKFPGGGIEHGESHSEALVREVLEETGYHVNKVHELLGVTSERRPDIYDSTKIFEMVSYYYRCDIGNVQEPQTLCGYEIELEMAPVWLSIQEALAENQQVIAKNDDVNPWLERESYVMRELHNKYLVVG